MEDFNYLKDCISSDWNTANNAQEKIADIMSRKLFEEIANSSEIEIIKGKILSESSVNISRKCFNDERWNVVERCFDVLKSSLIFKLNNVQPKPRYLTSLRIYPDWQLQDRIGWFGRIEGIY